MDDEDSQDELINKNIYCGKGKRPSASILSDEEEDFDDSHEEGSDSEEDDDSQDGEDEGCEEEDEEDESDHEDGVKEMEGAVGAQPTDLGLSSDEDAEKCPICLNSFHEQPVATPQNCEHYFCLDCILEWAKNANSCPVDRIVFSNILLRKCHGGKVQKTIVFVKISRLITVQRPVTNQQEEQVNVDLEQTSCEVCGGTDREDRLLLCDGCDAGYHMECLTPPLDAVPVEEWFCPECAPNNRNRRDERLSEEESSLPTTSRSWSSGSRPMRAIARTQHSERVRANVNRHRITQARTAAQLAPQYLMRSTWLDETINAVVAGLNTAVYVRDLTPRPRARRRRKRAPRKKAIKEGKDIKSKTSTTKVKRRKRKVRRTKLRKAMARKKTTAQRRIAQSLGIKKPSRSSSIPSVYLPCEQTLGSMRADIGAASLSIYGDPFDLDPFDSGEEEMEQPPVQPSLLEAKRRGLSHSALRSHQPVARPILGGLSRQGHGIPQVEEVAEATPVPDLLGSILSGQSLLLMDSSDVVINRDGSLKAPKPGQRPHLELVTVNGAPVALEANLLFRISSSGNPWHARRLSVPEQALLAKDKGSVKRNQKDKQKLLSSYSQAKKTSVESEVYDPFNPTGSDASESDDENDEMEINLQSPPPTVQTVGQNEDAENEIKTELMDLDLPVNDEMSGMKVKVKKEPTSPKDDSWSSPSHQPVTLLAAQSASLADLVASDADKSGNTTVKKETDSSSQGSSQLTEDSGMHILEDVLSISVSHKSHETKPIEIKEENDSPLKIKESQLQKDQVPKQIKVEQIWPGYEDSSSDDDDDDDALVINLSSPGPAPTDCETLTDCESKNLSVVPKEEMDVEPLQASCPVKQEPADSSDEEINVDYLIDNLDFIKKEMKDEPAANAAGALEPQADMGKESAGVKQETESVLVIGTKAKSQGKRVTWNIQEPVVSQPDKMSKLALFKLKLKQEGSRKATSSSSMQITGQVSAAVQGGSKAAAMSISSPALEGRSNSSQEKSKSRKEELLQNLDQKDKYMKKLHMQERAIEEVKLAIKPFYQKRDITKEEYKEILRKAVQKVCHSKSGEINPVKVANLVKAYVDKYKHAKKHRKAEEKQSAEGHKDSETPG
ncbi:hypothetical protein QTP70_030753 [Hemibagrus guttatus]|uniref:PHD and RING finger domain-containing protein 1 n=1 Tax=Hemibagrus guttatus TaxID=175788 RepID=A0AAE0QNC2_9TELE|nr:hypothetical protein QTP70_030753 [Hemibagrus guttatus]